MRHEQLHALLEQNTGLKWRSEHFLDDNIQPYQVVPKDKLYLFDDRGVLRRYSLEVHNSFSQISTKLLDFAKKINYSLIPAHKLNLDGLPNVTIVTRIRSYMVTIHFKFSGSITMEPAHHQAPLNYTLWGNLNANMQKTKAINELVNETTTVQGDIDYKAKEIQLKFSKSLSAGPVSVNLTTVNLKTFTGSVNFNLKKDEIRYGGWKFNGKLGYDITAELDRPLDAEDPLYLAEPSPAKVKSSFNISNFAIGGLILIGGAAAVCVISNVGCIAAIGVGGTVAHIAS